MNFYEGKNCPFCKTTFRETDDVVVCSECGMPHHKECWIENQGCSTFGCSGTIQGTEMRREAASSVSEMAQTWAQTPVVIVQSRPAGIQSRLAETQSRPGVVQNRPADFQYRPAEAQYRPTEVQYRPTEAQYRPAEVQYRPAEVSGASQVPVIRANFCPRCGTKREQDDLFCSECGHRFTSRAQSPSR